MQTLRTRVRKWRVVPLLLMTMVVALSACASGGSTNGGGSTTTTVKNPTPRDGALIGFDGGATKDVAYIDASGDVHLVSFTAGVWADSDIGAKAQAPKAKGTTLSGFADKTSGEVYVYYVDSASGDVVELSGAPGGAWHNSDVSTSITWQSVTAGDPEAMRPATPALAAVFEASSLIQDRQVAFFDGHGNLMAVSAAVGSSQWTGLALFSAECDNSSQLFCGEGLQAGAQSALVATFDVGAQAPVYLYVNSFGSMLATDFTLEANGYSTGSYVLMAPPSSCQPAPLSTYWWQSEQSYHADCLVQSTGQDWESTILTQQNDLAVGVNVNSLVPKSVGAPAGQALVAFPWNATQSEQVVWVDGIGHIQEAYYVLHGTSDTWTDVTTAAKAPLARSSVLAGFEWPSGGSKEVTYLNASNGHIEELSKTSGGNWSVADLTATAKQG